MSAAPEHAGSPPSPPTPSEVPTDPNTETIELGTENTPTASLQPGTPEKTGQSSEDDDDDDDEGSRALVEKVCAKQHLGFVADKAQKRAREEDPQDEEELDIVGGADELPPMTTVTIEAERPLKRARSSDE